MELSIAESALCPCLKTSKYIVMSPSVIRPATALSAIHP